MAFGMRGGLPYCPARLPVFAADFLHVRWSPVLPGVAVGVCVRLPSCVVVFYPAWHNNRCAWRSSVLSDTAVGMHGGLPTCTAYAAVFRPARPGCQCARQASFMRGGLPSCSAWQSLCVAAFLHAWWSSVLPGGAIGKHDGLPPCPVRLSVCAADYLHARKSSVLPVATIDMHGDLPFCPARPSAGAAVTPRGFRCARLSLVVPCQVFWVRCR